MEPQQDNQQPQQASGAPAGINGLHLLMRFLRTVRLRKHILFGTLVVTCALGLVYFMTATRLYESSAEMFVIQADSKTDEENHDSSSARSSMPTFQRLFTSQEVVATAISNLPPESMIDFEGVPEEKWVQTVQDSLNVRAVKLTNVLDISYRSKDPKTAVVVLHSLLNSYTAYLNKTYAGVDQDNIRKLQVERAALIRDVLRYNQALLVANQRNQGIILADGTTIHSQNISQISQSLVKAEQAASDAQTHVNAVKAAVNQNQDIVPYLQATMGRQLVEEQLLGVGGRLDVDTSNANKELAEIKTELAEALNTCLLYTSPSPRDATLSRMPSSA